MRNLAKADDLNKKIKEAGYRNTLTRCYGQCIYRKIRVNKKGELAIGEYALILQTYLTSAQKRAGDGHSDVCQTCKEVAENDNPPLRIRTSKWAGVFFYFKNKRRYGRY